MKKQKRIGGWILAVIVLLGIVGTGSRLSLVFAGQTGTSFEEAREIKKPELGKTLSGALTPGHARTYYQLTLKEPGRLSAEISSGKLPAIAFTLCDDQRRELASESFQGKEGWAAYLEKGTYYLIFSGTAEEKAVFSLKIKFSRAAAADVEPNDTIISPQPVLANAVYKGLLSLTDRTDVYTVKVEKPEKLYVAVKNEFTGTLNVQVKREGGAFFGSGTAVHLKTNQVDVPFIYEKEVDEGVYYITVEAAGDNGDTGIYTMEIRCDVAVQIMTASEIRKTVFVGDRFRLYAVTTPSNANETIYFKSKNPKVASVTENGIVKAKKEGKTIITLSSASGKTAQSTITVKRVPVERVTLNKKSVSLETGEKIRIKASVAPKNATDKRLVWSASNKETASVDKNGMVTAKAEGLCTITVTSKTDGRKAVCRVTVTEKPTPTPVPTPKPTRAPAATPTPVPEIQVQRITMQGSLSLGVGKSYSLSAVCSPSNAKDKSLTWSSSNSSVAKVSSGRVTGISKGSAVITVTAKSGVKAYCTVYVR